MRSIPFSRRHTLQFLGAKTNLTKKQCSSRPQHSIYFFKNQISIPAVLKYVDDHHKIIRTRCGIEILNSAVDQATNWKCSSPYPCSKPRQGWGQTMNTPVLLPHWRPVQSVAVVVAI